MGKTFQPFSQLNLADHENGEGESLSGTVSVAKKKNDNGGKGL